MSEDRRHAVIMFTDIVGYTSLMGKDEDRAFEVLRENREIHNNLIKKYNGKLIKEIGDGMLASYNLASDAVRCAIEIQNTCKEKDIPLKIGIDEDISVIEISPEKEYMEVMTHMGKKCKQWGDIKNWQVSLLYPDTNLILKLTSGGSYIHSNFLNNFLSRKQIKASRI